MNIITRLKRRFISKWRKTEMPKWVNEAYNKRRTKEIPYGKNWHFVGKNWIYEVYTTMPEFQGDSGEMFCYKKKRR